MILTCEHATQYIPPEFESLFQGQQAVLNSHRGVDIGASDAAHFIAKKLSVSLTKANVSRLLIDCNRSLRHPKIFSEWTQGIETYKKQQLINQYYQPYRQQVIESIKQIIAKEKSVFHLSVHSFTPELAGEIRNCDIGLLYDPKRTQEKLICHRLKYLLKENAPFFKTRFNYPYRGTSDGFATALRRMFLPNEYFGIELEINQKYFLNSNHNLPKLLEAIVASLKALLPSHQQ